ncbi:MAG: acyloxyacyl hydrolase [Micavibrio sp.]|nr:acyloxyacyl hydrolase [Micavibrio sp.]
MKKVFFASAIAAILLSGSVPARADTQSYLSLSGGVYDVLDKKRSVDFRAEYRSAKSIVLDNLHPYAGLSISSHGSAWVGGGMFYDYRLSPKWLLTPSFGMGVYAHGNGDTDLDYPIQFRTQLEISYEFANKNRLGLGLSHISNASMGDTNPGAEVISLYWHMPFDTIF